MTHQKGGVSMKYSKEIYKTLLILLSHFASIAKNIMMALFFGGMFLGILCLILAYYVRPVIGDNFYKKLDPAELRLGLLTSALIKSSLLNNSMESSKENFTAISEMMMKNLSVSCFEKHKHHCNCDKTYNSKFEQLRIVLTQRQKDILELSLKKINILVDGDINRHVEGESCNTFGIKIFDSDKEVLTVYICDRTPNVVSIVPDNALGKFCLPEESLILKQKATYFSPDLYNTVMGIFASINIKYITENVY